VDAIFETLLGLLVMVMGSALGVALRHALPDHHLNDHAKDVVRLGSALVATITALVLGLLINSAASYFEAQRTEVRRIAADVILLDTMLDNYGAPALPARRMLREAMDSFIDQVWNGTGVPEATPFGSRAHVLFNTIAGLPRSTPLQETLQAQSVATTIRIAQERLDLYERSRASLPAPIFYVLLFWLTTLFASFTLFSPLNQTSISALVVVALCASAALFLIFEMQRPFSGVMQVAPRALTTALPPLPPA
jgi:hypothetical protein